MRITNKMMTNNMMSNINKNKLSLNNLENQYSTGKKIQRPSDDPIVAVRALKLRTNLSELNQYYEKNIPDAMSWMDVTESALTNINDIIRQINTYCVQGSTDTLTANDRDSIVSNLKQLKDQIYQEGNSNYAGRYIFTGYKTDSSLIFTEDAEHLSYEITENISGDSIENIAKVFGIYNVSDYDLKPTEDFEDAPTAKQVYRIQLSYDKLGTTAPENIRLFMKDASGSLVEQTPFGNIVTKSVNDPFAYSPDPNVAHYIPETGEIILGSSVYEDIRTADSMKITYTKNGFSSGELKPEHYFDCVMTDTSKPEKEPVTFEKKTQDIQYEINFGQKLTVNTEGSSAISHKIGRHIDDIVAAVDDVLKTEEKIAEVEERLKDSSLSESEIERYNKLKEQLNTELVLKKESMQKMFAQGIAISNQEQDRVNVAIADLGSRYVRLELTENRLSSQQVDFEELLSTNEDVDIVETVIKYNTAEAIYNASLSAASKLVTKSLMDFL